MTPVRLAALLLALLLASTTAAAAATESDPRAVRVAEQVMKALGGRAAWDALPGIRWSFGSSVRDTVRSVRRHAWNKHTGEHRVQGNLRSGEPFVLLHTVGDTTSGLAWVNGNPIEGDSLRSLLRRAHAMWINDTYWLLMPYKLRDPGVTLTWEGEVKEGGHTYDKLGLAFDGVGLTPGDRYWVWVNRRNSRVERWEMLLQGRQPPPTVWTLEDWQQHDGLWFATSHRQGDTNVFTHSIEAVTQFPVGTFTAP